MEESIKKYKRNFDRKLRHIKLILTRERHNMPVKEWLVLVQETRESILNSPEEFFCEQLPSKPVLDAALEKVFEGFLEDQRLLAQQTSTGFKLPFPKKDQC